MEKLSLKEKRFLYNILGYHALASLDSFYAERDEKEFKETHGLNFKKAEEAMKKLRIYLMKSK